MHDCHQHTVEPGDALCPFFEGQRRAPHRCNLGHQFLCPWIVLAAFGAHSGIGRRHSFGMLRDAAVNVEVGGFKRADDRPTQAQSLAHDAIDIVDRGYTVAHQANRPRVRQRLAGG